MMDGIGFWGILYYEYNQEPYHSLGNLFRPLKYAFVSFLAG